MKLVSSLLLAFILSTASALKAQIITGGTFGTTYTTVSGMNTLNLGDTRTFTGTGDGVTWVAGHTLTINGSLLATDPTGAARAIRLANTAGTYTVVVGANGIVQAASNDAFQVRNAGSIFNLTNSGQILALTPVPNSPFTTNTGQALDITSSTAGGTILNNAGGLIQSDGHDAVRLGSNMTITNNGSIIGNSKINDNAANNNVTYSAANTFSTSEGVSFENAANSTLINNSVISGTRHGVDADTGATNVVITNNAAGTIIGKNGSGIGSDTTSALATNVQVDNYGLIRGEYAGSGNIFDRAGLASLDGDGDGIDIDGGATITNRSTGIIRSTGAGGFDALGRANNSEAISIGGGVITNSGIIEGADRGIIVNNDSVVSRSGTTASNITNNASGTITGLNGFAIRLENKLGDARDNDTITNAGTITGNGTIPNPVAIVTRQYGEADVNSTGILDGVTYTGTGVARFIRGDGAAIQTGEGNDTLNNSGTITGNSGRAVSLEGGADTLNITGNTAAITGSINGGAGSDTVNFTPGTGNTFTNASTYTNFETVNVNSGKTVLSGALTTAGGNGVIMIKTGGELSVANAGTVGDVTVESGGKLSGVGTAENIILQSGAILAPGNSPGTLSATSLTWDGGAQLDFELGTTSDKLVLSGALTKGAAGTYVFNIADAGGINLGVYNLLEYSSTTFLLADLSYTTSVVGLTGNFIVNGTQLGFDVIAVPEPSTYALLSLAAGAFAIAYRRRTVKSKKTFSAGV